MADERDENISDDQDGTPITGQQSQDNEFGARGQQAGSTGSQPPTSDQSDGMSGQPIGGNDSATGTGTTLTQGADFSDRTDDGDFGQGTTSNAGGSSVGSDQTSGGSSGLGGGEGFIGSQGSGSDEYLRDENDPEATDDQ